ncbi:MAG TPA: hypothetical protein VF805_12275, partial [Anaeromyxobacteraceae bacterium]
MPAPAPPQLDPVPFRAEGTARERLARLAARAGPAALARLTELCVRAPDPDLALAGVERTNLHK